MKCSQCKIDKLSNEFPSSPVTERCIHVSSHCLRCLVQSLNKQNEDEYHCPGCKAALNNEEVVRWRQRLDKASFKLNVDKLGRRHLANIENVDNNEEIVQQGNIYVVLLNGEKIVVDYEKVRTVVALRQEIRTKKKIEVTKQKLVYNGVELKDHADDNGDKNLVEYGIRANSHIQLMVILYEITEKETIKDLVFDLDWGFPNDQTVDYLDGTCFLYTGNKYWRKYDYQSQYYPSTQNTRHSGDVLNRTTRRGHHKITSKLDELPENVTHLYFILSAWNSPSIGCYKTPTFSLLDSEHPDKNLCRYELENVAHSKAVIMCSVARAGTKWNVYIVGTESAGNAKDYRPIEQKIQTMDGLF
ncbi:7298_t:CDS:2 [Paraglomus brasilianum]|uniref:7298_t:CDS:1 n=1 Tax=Paraglomus brasilianum TaxID=144538 RepID=A0A9N8ZAS0_9GLOM|nr:7298_t:CDS:2 [Paraglomus brasilianum]